MRCSAYPSVLSFHRHDYHARYEVARVMVGRPTRAGSAGSRLETGGACRMLTALGNPVNAHERPPARLKLPRLTTSICRHIGLGDTCLPGS